MSKAGGELICPKCAGKGMSDFKFWESKEINNNQKYYIFYNKKEERIWIFWTLLYYFGCVKKIQRCWDPCGCFNDICTNGKCGNDSGVCIILCKSILLIVLAELIFLFYFFFCLWFDIFNFFCTKKKTRIVCNGNTKEEILEKDDMWNNEKIKKLTEIDWICNYRHLFKCNSCHYTSDSFIDFTNNTVYGEINNNTNDTNNNTTVNNINTIGGDININGQKIIVHFVTSDTNQKINIQSYSSTLFSEVMNDLFAKIPDYKIKDCFFIYNNDIMNPDKTMDENHYKSGEKIICYKGTN